MLNNKHLKVLPYIIAIAIGLILSFLATLLVGILHDLLINIAATFFAVPLLYYFYETAKYFSKKKLTSGILDYAKMQVDSKLLSIINQLQKMVYPLEVKGFSNETVNKFLSLTKEEITHQLKQNKYLGFQVFKHWKTNEEALHELLKNPFVLEKMEDEQIISVINTLKRLRALVSIQRINDLYIETNETANNYKIESGINFNPENKVFPERYLLLKHLSRDKFVVYDFGDISKYNLEKCLNYYKINNKILIYYAEIISNLLNSINDWLNVTGQEFIIDSKIFRMGSRSILD